MGFSLRKLTLSVRLILPCFTEFRAYSFALSGKKKQNSTSKHFILMHVTFVQVAAFHSIKQQKGLNRIAEL
jgi:hypothetical protein